MNDNEQKRIFLAIVLSGIVLISWQAFFVPKNTADVNPGVKAETSMTTAVVGSKSPTKASNPTRPDKVTNEGNLEADKDVEVITLTNRENTIVIDSNLNIHDSKSTSSLFDFNEIFNADNPHQFQIIDQYGKYIKPFFIYTQKGSSSIEGYDKDLDLKLAGNLLENGKFEVSLNSPQQYRFRYIFNASKSEDSNLLKEYFVKLTEVERFTVGDDQEVGDGNAQWFGLDYHYHIFNYVLASKELVKYQADNNKFYVETVNPSSSHTGYYIFTKKNYDLLTNLGDNLHLAVDFGFFGILAEPILRALQYIYKYIPNYGIAIIILTLLVKLLTFPLQIKSFKSMKKMQKLQPELQKLKEKFKDDLPRQQKETMELFKKAGANPLGGCLPLILQMPVFFALYRVLYNAVELVQAPFYFWITDLSAKDPYYVLPVLMAVSMFGQTKLNPSTSTDPTQQKVMMFMPLIFGFFMKDLPAGLNLYIFVSTLFGIIQQLAVYRYSSD